MRRTNWDVEGVALELRAQQRVGFCSVVVLLCVLCAGAGGLLQAEDSAYERWYFDWRARDTAPEAEVHDLWGISIGANFNRYLGAELAADTFEVTLRTPAAGDVGEYSVNPLAAQLRLRYPMFHDRFVPYVVAGAGAAFTQFNDRKPAGVGMKVRSDPSAAIGTFGAGFDYFIADNVAIGLETRYLLAESQSYSVDDRRYEKDVSSLLTTLQLRVFFSELHPQAMPEERRTVLSRLYFGVHAGGAVLMDSELGHGLKGKNEVSAKGPFNEAFGAEVGVDLGHSWGVELSMDGHEMLLKADGIGAIGEYAFVPMLLQVRGQWPASSGRCRPYVVGGLGGAYTEFNDRKPGGVGLQIQGRSIGFAAGLGTGLDYYLASNFSFNAEARYVYSCGHSFRLEGRSLTGVDLSSLLVTIGFRLHLSR